MATPACFPRKLALEASGGALKNIELRNAQEERKAEKLLQGAEQTAAQLQDQTVTLKVRAGENDRLYGRVTASDIADAVERDLKVKLDKRKINLLDPIKSLGEYDVPVRLHRDVDVQLKVAVVSGA